MQSLALAMISSDSTSPHAPSFSCQAFGLTGSYTRLCHSESAQGQNLGYERTDWTQLDSTSTDSSRQKQNHFHGENEINKVLIIYIFLSVPVMLLS